MNLTPPPIGGSHDDLLRWCNDLYEFLKYPHFHAIRFIKRATPPESAGGVTYLDDDDDK